MQFGEHYIDELKARIRPSDVVGKHVKLKRQGREFAGLSPFTNEKTPSFFVNDEKGFYHCFSSGKHGDAISFLMEIEGLTFVEAVKSLANMAGMALPESDPEAEKRAADNKKSINWMEAAQTFFQKSLHRDMGEAARAYLAGRGLTPEDWQQFGIGFAPDSFDVLRDEMVARGAALDRLVSTGLLIAPDDNPGKKPWARFRGRIMFPITDPRGRIIAFGGRAMAKDAKAKYLNSPETALFHKGRTLYNYANARRALAAPKNPARGLIVAEGYMDVIALAKFGFGHAVAPLGTALTEEQLALLWRAGPEPVLCFDGDRAGRAAAYRAAERALPLLEPGKSVRFAILPSSKDPDDVLREDGKTVMQSILDRALPLSEVIWRREAEAQALDTPEAKAGLRQRLFGVINEIANESVKIQYRTDLLARFDNEYGRTHRVSRRNESARAHVKLSPTQKADMQENALQIARERRLVGAILAWPELIETLDQTFFGLSFADPDCAQAQRLILSYWKTAIAVDKAGLSAHIEANDGAALLPGFRREHVVMRAGMGGADASTEQRERLWLADAHGLSGGGDSGETHDRMTGAIRGDNIEALQRLMRSAKTGREN